MSFSGRRFSTNKAPSAKWVLSAPHVIDRCILSILAILSVFSVLSETFSTSCTFSILSGIYLHLGMLMRYVVSLVLKSIANFEVLMKDIDLMQG